MRAAGAVPWRVHDGEVEVLVIHRPRYDDWSFPKGKCQPGEPFAATATREVSEETGLVAPLGVSLGEVRYVDHRGRPKVVRYWETRVADGVEGNGDGDEVDRLAWMPVVSARSTLSYAHDVGLLDRLIAVIAPA